MYLTDILVSYSADLLDICCALGHVLERVSEQLQLILLVLGCLDLDTWLHDDLADNLLTDEVTVFRIPSALRSTILFLLLHIQPSSHPFHPRV